MDIEIKGLVQGVGFRPFIYRIAKEMGLLGEVYNSSSGVTVSLGDTDVENLNTFISRIRQEAPAVSQIESLGINPCSSRLYKEFTISASVDSNGITQISPDIAICSECLAEYNNSERRQGYPFVNCTNCGPRFSIVSALPYDRVNTTMNSFKMCKSCKEEYENPVDRRFHAQPIACSECGPHYSSKLPILKTGTIFLLKGMGGYNLVCNADDAPAVAKLRQIKCRPRKPFAVMVKDISEARKVVLLSDMESDLLQSWRRPIVVARKNNPEGLAGVANGYKTLGVMLPYMAIHYDFFKESNVRAVVITSCNFSHQPMIIDDDEALEYGEKYNLEVINYDRKIVNRVDDSVVQVVAGSVMVMRRGRGYAPEPIFDFNIESGIIGMGGEIVSGFAVSIDGKIILSQYLGSLENFEEEQEYIKTIENYKRLFSIVPHAIATDAHPGYASTIIGKEYATNIPLILVWHHHAHAVAVMTEHNLSGETLALCLDGTGLGCDGNIWGGELLKCNYTSFSRLFHLPYLPMPGGDVAAIESWRMAVSLVYTVFGDLSRLPENFVSRIGRDKIDAVKEMIDNNINIPLSSGAGRLFDAIASLIGISDENTYESESPILLEQEADFDIIEQYDINDGYKSLLNGIFHDYTEKISERIISSKFHNSIATFLVDKVIRSAVQEGIQQVVLSGGVFQNKILSSRIISELQKAGLKPLISSKIPCNDGGISIGQIKVASEMLKKI